MTEGMARLNRDTDGFIQPSRRKCSFYNTLLSVSLTRSGCFSPAVDDRNRRSQTGEKLWEQEGGDGSKEGDGMDRNRQGRTLSQQGVRRRVKRVMLSRGLPIHISSHYYFIPPSCLHLSPSLPFRPSLQNHVFSTSGREQVIHRPRI